MWWTNIAIGSNSQWTMKRFESIWILFFFVATGNWSHISINCFKFNWFNDFTRKYQELDFTSKTKLSVEKIKVLLLSHLNSIDCINWNETMWFLCYVTFKMWHVNASIKQLFCQRFNQIQVIHISRVSSSHVFLLWNIVWIMSMCVWTKYEKSFWK